MKKEKTIPDIFAEIFADFNDICDSGLDFIKRQNQYNEQLNKQ